MRPRITSQRRQAESERAPLGCHGSGQLPWDEARSVASGVPGVLRTVDVPLAQALGATLAAPLPALVSLPGCDVSAMDGYAVAGAGPWTVVGQILAGEEPSADSMRDGECLEVATGAPVPAGADAVVPYEEAGHHGDVVSGHVGAAGRHIRRRGEVCTAGTTLVPAGRRVTPSVIGLAAGVGKDTLAVTARPRVRVVVTGDEVVRDGLPGPGRVRDAVGPMLPGLVASAGGTFVRTQMVADDPDQLADALCSGDADVVAVCGASSVGPADHLTTVLARLGAETLVRGVACRPGHPQSLARLPGGRWVVGLPGNPFAALVGALTLLAPLLAKCAGRGDVRNPSARIEGEVSPHPTDTRLVAVEWSGSVVRPVGHDRPAALWGAAIADALAVVPPDWSGGPVQLLRLGLGSGSA
jgi:molybdopterin molybdotransferase